MNLTIEDIELECQLALAQFNYDAAAEYIGYIFKQARR